MLVWSSPFEKHGEHSLDTVKFPDSAPALHCDPCYVTHTHTHTHPFNSPFSGTTQVSWYQKGKNNLNFTEARDSEWQWHQLRHMQVCTLLQADNHTSTPPVSFYKPDALPAAQFPDSC